MRALIILYFLVFSFAKSNTDVVQIQKLVASDRGANDEFGWNVSIDGDYAIVGVPNEDEDASGVNTLTNAGSAYIYVRSGGVWTQQQKIVPSDRNANDVFGYNVSIKGNYAIVSAVNHFYDVNGLNPVTNAGAVYIFIRSGSTWTQQQKLVAPYRGINNFFGVSVSIDGDYALVGAHQQALDANGLNSITNAGAAYVFVRSGSTWSLQQKIVAPDRGIGTGAKLFGWNSSLNGNTIIVGAREDNLDENGLNPITNSGSAYIFVRSGSTWTFEQKIVASDRNIGYGQKRFGSDIAIYGNRAVVGASFEREDVNGQNTLVDAGSAYIFVRNGSTWTQEQKLVASDRTAGDRFGNWGVAINDDYVAISALFNDFDENGENFVSNAGSVYLFKRNGTSWTQQKKIVAPIRGTNYYFGFNVSLSGNDLFIGSARDALDANGLNSLTLAGAAFVFKILETPLFTTTNVSSISTTSAISGGNISDAGTNPILQRGVVWDINPNPTIALSTKTSNGTGTGIFTSNLTNLQKNTLYYIRSYVTTSQDTYYGNEVSFTTLAYEVDLDGNQDGILDELQDNVHTILDGYKKTNITIVSPTGTTINSVNTDIVNDNNFVYPFGQLEFKINASQAVVKLIFHGASDFSNYSYRKLFPDNKYKQFDNVTYSTETIGGKQVAVATLTLVDGGAGDYDGIVDGVIYDPGGPALPVSANIPFWDWWYALLLIPVLVYSYKRFS